MCPLDELDAREESGCFLHKGRIMLTVLAEDRLTCCSGSSRRLCFVGGSPEPCRTVACIRARTD